MSRQQQGRDQHQPWPVSEGARGVNDIVFTELSECEWRVTDGRLEIDNPFVLIGYVSYSPDRYEVMVYGDPVTMLRTRSRDEAVQAFVTGSQLPHAGALTGIVSSLPKWMHAPSRPRRHRDSYVDPADPIELPFRATA